MTANNFYSKALIEKINTFQPGKPFCMSDFTEECDSYDAIRQNLSRLAKKGTIKRLRQGIYYRPKYNETLKTEIDPYLSDIAQTVAKANHWNIIPTGDVILNELGLSTQVSSGWHYVSSGPRKTYKIGNNKIEFYPCGKPNISELSKMSAMIIAALKTAKQIKMGSSLLSLIGHQLTVEEKKQLFNDSSGFPVWMKKEISKICVSVSSGSTIQQYLNTCR